MSDPDAAYEPAMVIFRPERKGKAFIIPLDCLWRYVEPARNMDEAIRRADLEEFQQLAAKMNARARQACLVETRRQTRADIAKVAAADMLARQMGLLRSTAYSLVCGLTILEVTVSPVTAAQLLMWIQDRLDDLRTHPEHDQDDTVGVAGEVSLFVGSERIGTKDLTVSAADLVVPAGATRH